MAPDRDPAPGRVPALRPSFRRPVALLSSIRITIANPLYCLIRFGWNGGRETGPCRKRPDRDQLLSLSEEFTQ